MIQDGHKGAVLQRDRKTYAVAPHLPCGLASPELLRKVADVAEKYHAKAIKCTSAQRIAIIGIEEKDVDNVWAEFGETRPGHLFGDVVRSVKACPGTQYCKRAWQDSLQVGLELDAKYHGKHLPGKMKIGVSGCPNQCSETCIKDIGLVGGRRGWMIMIGGSGGAMPRLAEQLLDEEVPTARALAIVDALVTYFSNNAEPGERLGDLVNRVTLRRIRAAVEAAVGVYS
ncbi:MAG TPA: NAD(P)/FAD-dependent oxidoreductase [Phycisphaerae bacterium]|jgi:NAD(P)H-nitrite reductase large subunit|nr:NAD(P)/FAD-dependent oxidoreductase [Phycisphaerae bacterium]